MVRITQQLEALLTKRIKELDTLMERKRRERAELLRTLKAVRPHPDSNLRKGMPDSAKKKIAAAQRKRWALFRKNKGAKSHERRRKMALSLVRAA